MQQWRPDYSNASVIARALPLPRQTQQETPGQPRFDDQDGRVTMEISAPLQALLGLDSSTVALGAAGDSGLQAVRAPRDAAVSQADLTPEQHALLKLPFDTLIKRYAELARDDRPDAAEASDRLMTAMLTALRSDPARSADLTRLQNAYHPLQRFFAAQREAIQEAAAQIPQLRHLIRGIAYNRLDTVIKAALQLPPPTDAKDVGAGDRAQALVKWGDKASTLLRLAQERQAIQAVQTGLKDARAFLMHQARDRIVGGAARPVRDDVSALVSGNVVITAPDEAALRAVLVHMPVGSLVMNAAKNFGYFLKRKPETYYATYPPRGWRQTIHEIHWRPDPTQPDKQTLALLSLHGTPPVPSYSLDEGVTWKPTGAVHAPALTQKLANLWANYMTSRQATYVQQYHEGTKGIGGK